MPMEVVTTEKPLWLPPKDLLQSCQMEAFRNYISTKWNLELFSYHDLYTWSINNIGTFWSEVWEFCGIIHSKPFERVVDENIPMEKIPEWFHGARLNFAENLLKFKDDRLAIIYDSEYGQDSRKLSYRDLYKEVSKVAAALKDAGLKVGDVVAAFAGNVPEVVIFMLATASLGAIYTTIPPDYGPMAVRDRLIQTKPKILLGCSTVYYNGKIHDQGEKLKQIEQGNQVVISHSYVIDVKSVELIVILDDDFGPIDQHGDLPQKTISYKNFVREHCHAELDFIQLPFNHPLYILYSSGTTGKPKCLVHSAGGTLIQHLKEHVLHGDLRREDVVFQYTTISWMMWHWLVSVLGVGGTIVLYDGSPCRPDNAQLWRIIEKYKVSRFGTSAKYIQRLQETNTSVNEFDLTPLKTIYSTGSPLSVNDYHFVYEKLKGDIQLSSITGGTDIISLFGAGNPTLPVYPGEIQCAALGMAIAAFDEQGKGKWDQPGDLVCTKPFPSMPVSFWNDPDGKLYRAAYFDHFNHTWYHSDFVTFNSHTGGLVMLGRSDATLNPAGVRFGSAELYNVLTDFGNEIIDSLVVGVKRPIDIDEQVVMFLKTPLPLSQDLIDRIKGRIRTVLSPRHVPSLIMEAPEIPYTLNGKKVEVAVKRILSGNIAAASLGDPTFLDFYRQLAADPTFLN